jgi:iron complex outermembrane receptor protein
MNFADDAGRVILGYRAEHNHFSGWEHQPSLRVAWEFNEQHAMWVSASRATRTPSRLDTGFYAPEEPPYFIGGGPQFASEVLRAYELGWRGRVAKGASVTATLFFHDYAELRSVEPTFPITVANGVEGRSFGGELFLDWDVTRRWRLRLGYFNTEQETSPRPSSADFERGLGETSYPRYQVQLRNSVQILRNLSLWTHLRNVAAVPAFQDGIAGEVPAYVELDARLAWTVRPNVEVAVTGRNLLDHSHPEIGMDDSRREIQRSAHASIKWVF